jgi:hypothetical protein
MAVKIMIYIIVLHVEKIMLFMTTYYKIKFTDIMKNNKNVLIDAYQGLDLI